MLFSLYLLLLLEMFQISRSIRITHDGSFMLIHSPSSIVIVMYLLIHVFLVFRFVGQLYVRGKLTTFNVPSCTCREMVQMSLEGLNLGREHS